MDKIAKTLDSVKVERKQYQNHFLSYCIMYRDHKPYHLHYEYTIHHFVSLPFTCTDLSLKSFQYG